MHRLLATALFATACGGAAADTKPPEIASVIHAEQPYGSGSLKLLVVTVYDASLWTDAPRWSTQTLFALTLTYHMSFSSAEIGARSEKEMRHDDPALSAAALAGFRRTMMRVLPDVARGDRVTGLSRPGGTVEFFRNGRSTGSVGDPAFARAFFGIWLSPRTTEPALRVKLLHGNP